MSCFLNKLYYESEKRNFNLKKKQSQNHFLDIIGVQIAVLTNLNNGIIIEKSVAENVC